jgi:hypothetical protein
VWAHLSARTRQREVSRQDAFQTRNVGVNKWLASITLELEHFLFS